MIFKQNITHKAKEIEMKVLTFMLTIIPALTLSHVCYAGNSGDEFISYYKIDHNRVVVYAQAATFTDTSSCKDGTATSSGVAISTERENFKELYASIMLAHANDRKIAFWLDGGCSAASSGGPFPTASMVYVY